MLKVLFLCTENACRSQMAEGLVNHFLAGKVEAFSAGVAPKEVNPRGIRVMAELGVDLSRHRAKSVSEFAGQQFDLAITLCDSAQQQCPFFPGAAQMLHVGFPDPGRAQGTEDEIMAVFRRVRDEMREKLIPLLAEHVAHP
ncbi:MAG: arsenate reductase ArsC [Desulfobaccales bacterium]